MLGERIRSFSKKNVGDFWVYSSKRLDYEEDIIPEKFIEDSVNLHEDLTLLHKISKIDKLKPEIKLIRKLNNLDTLDGYLNYSVGNWTLRDLKKNKINYVFRFYYNREARYKQQLKHYSFNRIRNNKFCFGINDKSEEEEDYVNYDEIEEDIFLNENEDFEDFFEQELYKEKIFEYFYDIVRLELSYGKNIVFNIFDISLNKNLNFLDGNNNIRGIFFSDFIFELNKNFTVEEDSEFNNFVFFSKSKFFNSYNLLNAELLTHKVGYTTKVTDPEIFLYANSELFNYLYSLDYILRYSISFLFCFFIPYIFYSCFELSLLVYCLFYYFSWTIPDFFFEFYFIKIIKFIVLLFFGEKNYEIIVSLLFNPEPVFLFISERSQFFIFITFIFLIWLWFMTFVSFLVVNLFSFFVNIYYKYYNTDNEGEDEISLDVDPVEDEMFDDELFAIEDEEQVFQNGAVDFRVPDEGPSEVMGEECYVFMTPFSFFYEVLVETLLMSFLFIIYDLYLTFFFNTSIFIFFNKILYYFISFSCFELFAYVDFYKKVNFFSFLYFFVPLFFGCFYLYYAPKVSRFFSDFYENFFEKIRDVDYFPFKNYSLKNFSLKIKDLVLSFIFSYSPSIFKDNAIIWPEKIRNKIYSETYIASIGKFLIDILNMPKRFFISISYVNVFLKSIPKFLIVVFVIFLSIFFSEFIFYIIESFFFLCGIEFDLEIFFWIFTKVKFFFSCVVSFYKFFIIKLFDFLVIFFFFFFIVFLNLFI